MCGRFSFVVEDALIRERFGITVRSAIYKARYNCAPSQELGVITNQDPHTLQAFHWGLIPFWVKERSVGYRLINARAETITEKPSFRAAFLSRRCLVPADSFYEWKKNGTKVPYRILLNDEAPFAMAGIWERWASPADGTIIYSFTIITTTPNELMAPIHDRMPVILAPEEEQHWLQESDPSALASLLKPYPSDRMHAYRISPMVNSPANDTAAVWEQAE